MRWSRAVGSIAVLAVLGVFVAATPAGAKPIENVHFHVSFTEPFTCGDVTVRFDVSVDRTFSLKSHGRDGLAYEKGGFHGTDRFTNEANGRTLTAVENFVTKDLKVTDNGNGTLTIIVISTGSVKLYGPDGKLLFNDPGQTRSELLIDHGGTPNDPTDDELVQDPVVIKGSTGRNDLQGRDACDVIHEYIA